MTHVVLLLVALFAIGCLAVEKRRDDKVRSHFTYFANNFQLKKKLFGTSIIYFKYYIQQWPPPEIIERFKPIGQVCRQKTGVTEGMVKFSPHYFGSFPNFSSQYPHHLFQCRGYPGV